MKLTSKQEEAQRIITGPAKHVMLFGGSRSGKTFLHTRNTVLRAIKAPGSRHAILRFRFNHVKASIVMDTFPKVMSLAFPGVDYHIDKTDWFCRIGESTIWFGGLDDKERTEKILGQEHVTIFLNECSQISWVSQQLATTRLAQNVRQSVEGQIPKRLKPRMFYDCVIGDTLLDGQQLTIAELARIGKPVEVLTTHGKRLASAPWMNGVGIVCLVKTDTGRSITVTPSHRFYTQDGWRRLDEITTGQKLLCIDEHQISCGVESVQKSKKKDQGSNASYCKYRRQYDAQSRLDEVVSQAYPAFAYGGEEHSQSSYRHDEQGFHKDRKDQREARYIHHNREFRGLPFLSFACHFLRNQALFGWQAFGLFPQIHQFFQKLVSALVHRREEQELTPSVRLTCVPSLNWRAILDRIAVGKQWLRYNLVLKQFQGQKNLCSISSSVHLCSFDTPLVDSGVFETVVEITTLPAVAYYTIDVPVVNHYSAHGFVSHNCNPPSKGHWTYKMFVQGVDPGTKQPLRHPEDYVCFQVNPIDNIENLPEGYLGTLQSLSGRLQRRFLDGEFADATPNAMFHDEDIDRWRVTDGKVPDMVRIVVGVDPSGSGDIDNDDNDEIGIVVDGLGTDGNCYVLEDCTVKAGPATWGNVATTAYDRHEANVIVGEVNYGGAMVQHVIQTARARTPYKAVTASRGKHVRAEPFSALYEKGKCVARGTLISMERGPTRIEDVRAGDWTWTRAGLREIIWAGSMGHKPTIEVFDSDGNALRCTEDHPVLVGGNKWVRAIELVPSDILTTWTTNALTVSRKQADLGSAVNRARRGIAGLPQESPFESLLISAAFVTFCRAMGIGKQAGIMAGSCSIARYGEMPMATFLQAVTFITSKETKMTIGPRSWRHLVHRLTGMCTFGRHVLMWLERASQQLNASGGRRSSQLDTHAASAVLRSYHGVPTSDFVHRPAIQNTGIVSVKRSGEAEVFDLTIDSDHEYFAGGVLVHNCRHVGYFPELEGELTAFGTNGYTGSGSPNRADAHIWAMSELFAGIVKEKKPRRILPSYAPHDTSVGL